MVFAPGKSAKSIITQVYGVGLANLIIQFRSRSEPTSTDAPCSRLPAPCYNSCKSNLTPLTL